jgi:hypothetical protein
VSGGGHAKPRDLIIEPSFRRFAVQALAIWLAPSAVIIAADEAIGASVAAVQPDPSQRQAQAEGW